METKFDKALAGANSNGLHIAATIIFVYLVTDVLIHTVERGLQGVGDGLLILLLLFVEGLVGMLWIPTLKRRS